MKNPNDAYLHAAELIAGADALVIAAGAGMGVDSGLPDFRGNEGFWKAYPALARANLNFMDVADPRTFETDPQLAWGFYGHRLNLYRQTIPHAGFDILRKWGERTLLGSWIFTSNVDGQFQKAGFSEEHIHECHGSIHHLQCMNECESGVWSATEFTPAVDDDTCRLLNAPPLCPHCGGLARPNIMMFGDWNWQHQRSEAQRRREDRWLDSIGNNQARVVIVEMGAGNAIPSVRHFSHRISRDHEACIIRINPCESKVPSSRDIGFASGSLEALRGIDLVIEDRVDG
ncbi:MAG: SIR2 family NAD-dependent protein deacylase [Polaromonas sp.]